MCGISVIVGVSDRSLTDRILKSISHRGPDASGIVTKSDTTLGHRRLSIMDPSHSADQPILSEDKKTAIVANGEIYNYKKLRRKLSKDHVFTTDSDTEAVLHLYEEAGTGTASFLDGMFAFVISGSNGEIYAARDPLGIKPLYYGYNNGNMLFASEIKALSGVAEDVREFPPGTYFHSKTGFSRYFDLGSVMSERRYGTADSIDDICEEIRILLVSSVRKRLMSDVPLGAFLSGGLDSSIIAAIARDHVEELHTFSVGLEGSSDLEAAREVADYLKTVHHEYLITDDDVKKHLPEILFHLESFDQDLVRSAVPCYFVSRLASEYVKVILTGEGADELFGGYSYYKKFNDRSLLISELSRSVTSLHNINLQRVDRLTMAHSIEGRVPFLDIDLVTKSLGIPADLKIRYDRKGSPVEKWILRKAFENYLPYNIVWREKEQFDEGSGASDILEGYVSGLMSDADANSYMIDHFNAKLRSTEECVYHRILSNVYADPSVVFDNVARWAERPQYSEIT